MGTPYVKESPIEDWVEDESRPLRLTIPGATITGTPTVAIYNEQTNTSATNLSSTNGTPSGNTVTTGTLQSLKGGQTYTLAITAVVDGATKKYLCVVGPVAYPYGAI